MRLASLTFKGIVARPVVLKLERPIVARIATITDWPLILIDLYTEEGVVGRSYLEPYTTKTMKYLIPALQDFGEMFKGQQVTPLKMYELARKSLHFVGYQGTTWITTIVFPMGFMCSLLAGYSRHPWPKLVWEWR
jgi:mandelate racemase